MPEVYGFPEGRVFIYTGHHTATGSTPVALVQDTRLSITWQWQSDASLSGVYRDHLAGYRVDITVGMLYTYGDYVRRWAQSGTAVHMKLEHSGVNGSAGYYLYSAHIDSVSVAGSQGGVFAQPVAAHCHNWSAF